MASSSTGADTAEAGCTGTGVSRLADAGEVLGPGDVDEKFVRVNDVRLDLSPLRLVEAAPFDGEVMELVGGNVRLPVAVGIRESLLGDFVENAGCLLVESPGHVGGLDGLVVLGQRLQILRQIRFDRGDVLGRARSALVS